MSRPGPLHRVALALAAGVWLGSCSEPGGPGSELPPIQGILVSDPTGPLALAAARAIAASAPADPDLSAVTFVSLVSASALDGQVAFIRNLTTGVRVSTLLRDGGFDPMPIPASVDDTVEIQVYDAQQSVILEQRIPVSRARPPVVARTNPPRRKRDVPLNTSIVIAFSEPVAPATVTPTSIRVMGRGLVQLPIPGTLRVLAGTGTRVAFTPLGRLVPNSDYELVISDAVRDLDGSALAASATVSFRTGQSTVGPPAFVWVTPDTVRLYTVGATYQMTATAYDSAGNELVDQPEWFSADPEGLTVSPTGLVTVLARGQFTVLARVNNVIGGAVVKLVDPPASIEIAPAPITLAQDETMSITARVFNAAGDEISDYPTLVWAITDPGIATLATMPWSPLAQLTGVAPGTATITVVSGPAIGSFPVTVIPPQPVGSVTVTPDTATILAQGTIQLSAALRDIDGRAVTRPISWASDNPAVATVTPGGIVTGVAAGSAAVVATSEGVSDTASITVTVVNFVSVSAGMRHTCGLTTDSLAYCWGEIPYPDSIALVRAPRPVEGGLRFASISAGQARTCALTASGEAYCWGSSWLFGLTPVRIPGWTFSSLVVGTSGHFCGLTTTGAAYCWGSNQFVNQFGELGDGTTTPKTQPTAVLGGLTFRALAIGTYNSTCGLTTDSTAYCWGRNEFSQLGVAVAGHRPVPTPVSTGEKFVTLVTGFYHACALAASGLAYCWGANSLGQSGIGTWGAPRAEPVQVQSAEPFASLSAKGGQHACGLTAEGVAHCWGLNEFGQLGVPPTTAACTPLAQPCSTTPVAVVGDLRFQGLHAGGWHTCGLSNGTLYCWGQNVNGALGDGSLVNRSSPVKVIGQP